MYPLAFEVITNVGSGCRGIPKGVCIQGGENTFIYILLKVLILPVKLRLLHCNCYYVAIISKKDVKMRYRRNM